MSTKDFKYNPIPSLPPYEQIFTLLHSMNDTNVQDWTSKEKCEAYEALKILAFHSYRKEDILGIGERK